MSMSNQLLHKFIFKIKIKLSVNVFVSEFKMRTKYYFCLKGLSIDLISSDDAASSKNAVL